MLPFFLYVSNWQCCAHVYKVKKAKKKLQIILVMSYKNIGAVQTKVLMVQQWLIFLK